jgi:hypothetical protein
VAVSARIYAGGALLFGGQPAVDDLIAAGYSAVIIWTIHVSSAGDLTLNDTPLVTGGEYQSSGLGDFAARLAQLKQAGMQVIFCVGEDKQEKGDYYNIYNLLNAGPGSQSYKNFYSNFSVLLKTMSDAGADIDAIDMDNEDYYENNVVVLFSDLLKEIGYPSVTFCPYNNSDFWQDSYNQLTAKYGASFVSAFHLQCYDGGSGNDPSDWGAIIGKNSDKTLLIPGLASNQAQPGPWWQKNPGGGGQMGGSVVETSGVAMYGHADWSKLLRVENYASVDLALQSAKGGETFFFYCNGFLDLGPEKQFQPGDAVFFAGEPWWGSAPQCDAYSLSQGCSNRYNYGLSGACPSDLQTQYAAWKKEKYPPAGGFIWMYDSIVSCLLAGCCGGTEKSPATTAASYRQAIADGLS